MFLDEVSQAALATEFKKQQLSYIFKASNQGDNAEAANRTVVNDVTEFLEI